MFIPTSINKRLTGLAIGLISTLLSPLSSADSSDIRVLVVPQQEAKLASQLNERIVQLPLKNGERFKKGDLLVAFDCAVRKAEMQRDQAELKAAKATLASNQKLRKLGSGTQLELDTAKAKVEKHQAQVNRARALVRQCQIRAPFSGRVHETLVNRYESVRTGEPLLEILDDAHLHLELFVPSNWLKHLVPGQSFEVHIAETDQYYLARISSIGARVDPVSRSVAIRGKLQKQHPELLAGMSGRAYLQPVPSNSVQAE